MRDLAPLAIALVIGRASAAGRSPHDHIPALVSKLRVYGLVLPHDSISGDHFTGSDQDSVSARGQVHLVAAVHVNA